MARRRRASSGGAGGGASGTAQYVALEARLVLLAWLNKQFGYERNRDLLADLEGAAEGFDGEGRSYVCLRLLSRGDKVQVPPEALARYDDNIRSHLRAMNAGRSEPLVLRYFQYAAALYTELFLDRYFHRRGELIRQLNRFVDRERNRPATPTGSMDARFSEADLGKLAFWMATGSGKTLVLHLNYRQFLHYNGRSGRPLDNILLITPNEGLSEQHMAEMQESGIACRRFSLGASGLAIEGRHAVRVIEITKLVETKRGGGASVPVEAFEGNNLIFVDEGHKGAGGEAWRSFRDALGRTGFTFEYSATFGQALTAARNDRLTEEYGKAIVFDYSYRYFHGDGYGKDFRILNLTEETAEHGTRMLLLGNLLSFYEQQRVFGERAEALRPYHLERPLQVFVGGTVNAVYTRDGRKRSDVLDVARFLHGVLENRGGWAVAAIGDLLDGKTGLTAPDGRDVFEGRFQYLGKGKNGMSPEQIYRDVLLRVLHARASGGLHLSIIRGGAGEIGLKASGADDYFGLIYIGDTGAFKKLVEQDDSGIVLEEDVVADSLFGRIGDPDTTIDMLIGAKKFMEGWNSWRVSNMGLLNVGRREGSEIIQLFGRGVRLRGREFGLKRSAALNGEHPPDLDLLETLNVFAVRANYMARFREYLEREGVEPEGAVELSLPIEPNKDFLGRGLVVPRVPEDRSFAEEEFLLLEPDGNVRVRVDLSLKVQELSSGGGGGGGAADGVGAATMRAGRERPIPDESLDLVDWEEVYLELLAYKESKGFANLAVRPETARQLLTTRDPSRLYGLIADESVTEPGSFDAAARLREVVVSILGKYMDRFHRVRHEAWESEHMVYKPLDRCDANFQDDYTIKVPRGEAELIEAIRKLIDQADAIREQDRQYARELPSIHFDRHLYQPLLLEKRAGTVGGEGKVRSDPPGLKESERQFVDDLRRYCRDEKDGTLVGKEVYLLRNLERGRGVGFFETRGFYPDFILWIKSGAAWRIVFVEPHGMVHAGPHEHDHKARLHETLPALAQAMGKRTGTRNVTLDSFIVSATPYEALRPLYDDGSWDRERFAAAHIVFPEHNGEYDYLPLLMGG